MVGRLCPSDEMDQKQECGALPAVEGEEARADSGEQSTGQRR